MFTITIFMKKAILFLSVVIVSNVYAQTYLSGDIIITNPSKVSGSLNYDFPSGTTGSFSYDGKELSLKIEKTVFNNVSTSAGLGFCVFR